MFESAQRKQKLSKPELRESVQTLRTELLSAQVCLFDGKQTPVVVLISGQDGAGKSETINLLYEWMTRALFPLWHYLSPLTRSANARPCGAIGAHCRLKDVLEYSQGRGTPILFANESTMQ